MHNAFSSPILIENTAKLERGLLLKHFENAIYAIEYHLENILPKGGIVCAFFPKSILEHVLPAAAQKKNCKVINVQGTKEAIQALMKAGVLDNEASMEEADIYITEPDGFTTGGALVRPEEAKTLKNIQVMGVGSIFQKANTTPATHDYIPLSKMITELGIYSPEHIETSTFQLGQNF